MQNFLVFRYLGIADMISYSIGWKIKVARLAILSRLSPNTTIFVQKVAEIRIVNVVIFWGLLQVDGSRTLLMQTTKSNQLLCAYIRRTV